MKGMKEKLFLKMKEMMGRVYKEEGFMGRKFIVGWEEGLSKVGEESGDRVRY